jgi:hypothetical protein
MLSLAAAAAAFGDAYRWVDEEGVVQYSDRSHPGAVRIVLQTSPESPTPIQRSAPSPRAQSPATAQQSATQTEEYKPTYSSLVITSPNAEEHLWNIGGTLNVRLNLRPALRAGDQFQVSINGEPQTFSGTSFEIPEIYRGTHSIQVDVIGPAGQLRIRGENTQFYVHQTSVN